MLVISTELHVIDSHIVFATLLMYVAKVEAVKVVANVTEARHVREANRVLLRVGETGRKISMVKIARQR